ncbi:MAG: hypothetical protein RIG63_25120 [Coleofasciculus chthonoplastes F3-SA18-01]|uniref:hypothetical protein n=1 Tax=Coleofasciculus chthonoplastes TaxID=64178 RepID=UPI003303EE54
MITDLPRLLIVSELTLSFSKKGQSANPTLFNLFENYPPELLLQFTPTIYLNNTPPAPPFQNRAISFNNQYLSSLNNRLGKLINPFSSALNLQLLDLLPIANHKAIKEFDPEVILVCPITPDCLIVGKNLTQLFNCPFIIYFMDDWIAVNTYKWLSGTVQSIAKELLQESDGWLMISEQLQKELSNRYQFAPKQSMIVHNPVDLSAKDSLNLENNHTGTFTVAYAGSIQVMHYDALAAVAEAIFQLRLEGKDIELVLYTSEVFWKCYEKTWRNWDVKYSSLIPYQELNQYLNKADLLLVATSFLPEYAHVVRSSVLTKLTDYMMAGRPILSCGPDYSACNQFINQWGCGLVCETNNIKFIKYFLQEQIQKRTSNQKLALKAIEALKNNFEKKYIHSQLYNFISKLSKNYSNKNHL